jgi:hypothetical protein
LIKNFYQKAKREITVALELAEEEEADSIDFFELYEELESQERRVNMKSRNLQHAKLEIGRGAYQPGEQLEEVGFEPTHEEMTEVSLLEEEVEKQLNGEIA